MTLFHKSALVVLALSGTAAQATDTDYVRPKNGLFYGLDYNAGTSAWNMTFAVQGEKVTVSSVLSAQYNTLTPTSITPVGSGDEQVWWGPPSGFAGSTTYPSGTFTYQDSTFYCWITPETLSELGSASRGTYTIDGNYGRFFETCGVDPDSPPTRTLMTFRDLDSSTENYIRAYVFAMPPENTKAFTITMPYTASGKTFCAYFITRLRSTQSSGSPSEIFTYHVEMRKFKAVGGTMKIRPVDTRVTYGEPDKEGILNPDPNASLGFVKFNNWGFAGGLFIGNGESASGQAIGGGTIPPARKDKSGLARILAKPATLTAPSGFEFNSCSVGLYDLGRPNRGTGYPATNMAIQCESGGDSSSDESLWSYGHAFNPTTTGTVRTILGEALNGAGPTKDMIGSTDKYYFWGSQAFDPATQFLQLRHSLDTPTTTVGSGEWRYFVSDNFSGTLTGTEATKYSTRKPVAGWIFKGTTNYATP